MEKEPQQHHADFYTVMRALDAEVFTGGVEPEEVVEAFIDFVDVLTDEELSQAQTDLAMRRRLDSGFFDAMVAERIRRNGL